MYNKHMNDTTDKLPPVDVVELLNNFSDFTIAELAMEITRLREKLEHEKKLVAAKEFKLQKAEEQIELLTTRINTATAALSGTTKTEETN